MLNIDSCIPQKHEFFSPTQKKGHLIKGKKNQKKKKMTKKKKDDVRRFLVLVYAASIVD